MKFLKWIILPLIFLTVLAYILIPAKLRNDLWYQYKIMSSMRARFPFVNELMTNSLKNKYNEEFVVERLAIWGDLLGCWYQAQAHPVTNPVIKFKIQTDLFSFGNGNFSEKKLLSVFYDDYPSEVAKHRTKNLEALFQNFYPPEDFAVYCRFIKGSDEAFKRLRFNKELVVDNWSATAVNDMALQISIYVNKFVIDDEAEKLFKIFSRYLSSCKLDRYIITASFYNKNRRSELEKKRQQIVSHDKTDNENYTSFVNNRFKEGFLLNSCVLFEFGKSNNVISKQQVIDSFIIK